MTSTADNISIFMDYSVILALGLSMVQCKKLHGNTAILIQQWPVILSPVLPFRSTQWYSVIHTEWCLVKTDNIQWSGTVAVLGALVWVDTGLLS